MVERIAIFPGSFDPPHNGHIDMLRQTLQTGKVDHVVVVSMHNPTKTRLLTLENSTALIKKMLPPDIADRVTVCESTKSVPKLASQFNAVAVVRGKRKTEHPIKNIVHEIAIAGYLTARRIMQLRKPLHVTWLSNSAAYKGLSSTKLRRILLDKNCSREKLEKLVPPAMAKIFNQAKAQCPDVSKENNQ